MRTVDVCKYFIFITLYGELSEKPEIAPQQHEQKYILPKQPEHPFTGRENLVIIVTNDENPARHCYCQAHKEFEQVPRRF